MHAPAAVRLYAELNDLVRRRDPGGRYTVPITHARTVKDVIESLGVPHTEVDLVLCDGASVTLDTPVAPGASLSVYPVFETFDVAPAQRIRRQPLRVTRFVADVHLGTLARNLRVLGFDTLWAGDVADGDAAHDDAALADISARERRVLLTRDRGLLMRRIVTHGACLRTQDAFAQTLEVLRRYDLAGQLAPFTRCLRCNGTLEPVTKAQVHDRLPPRTRIDHERFVRCRACRRVFWPGSHHDHLEQLVADLTSAAGRSNRG